MTSIIQQKQKEIEILSEKSKEKTILEVKINEYEKMLNKSTEVLSKFFIDF